MKTGTVVLLFYADGNTTKRDYGPADRPFMKIGRGVMYTAIFTIVKGSCAVPVTDQQIQKSIREGLNTIRLHDRDVKIKKSRVQAQQHDDADASSAEFIEQPEFIEQAGEDSEYVDG